MIKEDVTEKYDFLDLIGSGASGRVFLASVKETEPAKLQRAPSQMKESQNLLEPRKEEAKFLRSPTARSSVAIKVLSKENIQNSPNGLESLIQEVKVHWALEECDGILRLLEIYEDECFVYLVLEFQSEGSLMNGL